MAYPRGLGQDGRLLAPDRWEIELRPWFGNGCVDLTPAGRAHMIRHFWRGDAFHGWYVNLQRSLVSSPFGSDTMDQQLDLWVAADGAVTWKDEDHLEQAVRFGMFDEAEAASARAEAERVLEDWPFPTGWEHWRPEPWWLVPELAARAVVAGPGASGGLGEDLRRLWCQVTLCYLRSTAGNGTALRMPGTPARSSPRGSPTSSGSMSRP